MRKVTRTATVPLEGNSYAVDPALTGRRVELRYDPEDLSRLDVFCNGKPAGAAVPFVTRRHVHRAVAQAAHPPNRPPPASTTSAWSPPPTTRKPAPTRKIDYATAGHAHRQRPTGSDSHDHATLGSPLRPRPVPRSASGSPPKHLFARAAHAEAVARISFCIAESTLGVVTGEVGVGKTVALRAAAAGLDPTRHQVIYIPNPAFGTRGLYVTIVRALGAAPRYLKAELMAQASDLLAAEDRRTPPPGRADRGRGPPAARQINSKNCGYSPTPRWTPPAHSPAS